MIKKKKPSTLTRKKAGEKTKRRSKPNPIVIIGAMNEEMPGASEEMVSGNDEYQSINEKLQSINQELQTRKDQLSEALCFADAIFTTMREAFIVLDNDLRIVRANSKFYKLFNTTEEETERRLVYELGNGQWDIPKLRELLDEIVLTNKEFFGYEVNHVFPHIGEKMMVLNARKIEQPAIKEKRILLAIEDITEHILAKRVLLEREVWFRDMANNAPVMIWTSDEKGNRTFFNNTWLEFTGKTLEEEVGMEWMKDVNRADREHLRKIYTEAFQNREPYQAEYRLMRHDGEFRWMLSVAKPFYDINKNFIGFIGTVTEIHDQRIINEELEQRVHQRTQALQEANVNLERSNNELQQFAYVASHDLQEPLRKIITFVDRLQKKYRQNLPDEAKDFMDRIVDSSGRMSRLIDDLLNFSRATRNAENFTRVDLNHVLKNVLKTFDLTIQKTQAEVNIEPLPVIKAVPVQMMQLFHNLLSNALKFIGSERPIIRISSHTLTKEEIVHHPSLQPDNNYCEIIVSDNGIGFKQEYAEQIFQIFKRLHGKSEFPGTGIGLALCRKIVGSHEGIIFANSKEKEGTDFHVILPLK